MIKHILIFLVKGYRLILSPWLGSSCRFTPTCSAYALEALQTYNAAKGSYLTLRRLSRCHPWCEGGHDPVTQSAPVTQEGVTSSNSLTSIANTP